VVEEGGSGDAGVGDVHGMSARVTGEAFGVDVPRQPGRGVIGDQDGGVPDADVAGAGDGRDRVEPVGTEEPGLQRALLEVVRTYPAHREVQAAGGDPGRLRVGRSDPRVDVQLSHRGDAGGQIHGEPVDVPEPNRLGTGHPRRAAPQVIGLFQHGAGVREQGGSGRGQADGAAVAVEQPYAEVTFERLDLLGQGGTGDQQPLGGAAEVELFGDRDEVPQLTELHLRHATSLRGCASQQEGIRSWHRPW
jgi:hypothetical protein